MDWCGYDGRRGNMGLINHTIILKYIFIISVWFLDQKSLRKGSCINLIFYGVDQLNDDWS